MEENRVGNRAFKSIYIWWRAFPAFCMVLVSGCATFNPHPGDEFPFMDRTQTQYKAGVRVTAAVPSAEESEKLFGVDLYGSGVQPVWLKIENTNKKAVFFLPLGLDPEYFTPFEAAYRNHYAFSTPENDKMDRYFFKQRQRIYIDPDSVIAGFVYTPVDEGTKGFNVDIIGEDQEFRTFLFFINVPGLRIDHYQVDFEHLYSKEKIVSLDEKDFRRALENLPCCTTNEEGTGHGDPLNLVVIGEGQDVLHAFIRAGWDEAETIYSTSAWKTGMSFLFGGRYRYSPVSGLYVYGRRQDAALQQARETIHERNHLRLWLSPMRFEDKPVWVGQISRDIGVRFWWKTITTHKIDPDVDETRGFLVQDLWYSHGLLKFAFVKGVGEASISDPRRTLTNDPYFTDGLRAMLWVSGTPVDLEDVEFADWETPPIK